MPTFRAAPVHIRVPATSANLGPGFDAFGLALSLYDDVIVRIGEDGLDVDVVGEGAETLPRTEKHLIVRAARATFKRLGGQPRGLEIRCNNRIPHGRGLGSSAAAICAGILAARAVTLGGESELSLDDVFALATLLEGHSDNVAACLYGGFAIAWHAGERPRAVSLTAHADVVPVVFVPEKQVPTAKARALLPDAVPHADAALSAGRAGLLVHALTTRPDLLLDATEDRLHQDYRAPAMAASAKLIAGLRADGVPAVVSGAGPAVLALVAAGDADDVAKRAPRRWTGHRLQIVADGAAVGAFNAPN